MKTDVIKTMKENKNMKKGIKVLVKTSLCGNLVEEIFVSKARILRLDDRKIMMQGSAIDIARKQFCKKNNLDAKEVGRTYRFKAVEYNM